MLSSHRKTGIVKSAVIKDDRWSTKDKLDQYRGVLRLYDLLTGKFENSPKTGCVYNDYARKIREFLSKQLLFPELGVGTVTGRERKLGSQDAGKLKKRISWQLGLFHKDVKKYRRIINDTARGISDGRIHSLLQGRKDLQLRCQGRDTEDIYVCIYEESNRKRRQLDKLRYEKKTKMKRCFELQRFHLNMEFLSTDPVTWLEEETYKQGFQILEHAEFFNDYTQEQEAPWSQCETQQQLITNYQRSMAKQNAAKAISITYTSMLGILKQDSVHHETLLDALKQDQQSQCKVIFKTTIMGQLAVEHSDDIGEKCKRVNRKVWNNMKERERALTVVRGQVEDLWSFARSLIRTESEPMFTMDITRATTASHAILENQIRSLEEVFGKVKDSLLVRSYRELLLRLEIQMKQRTRLLDQFDRNVKERDLLLNKKTEALSTLSDIEHSLVASGEEYNGDRNILLEQIAMEKKREFEQKNARKERGKLLMDVRAALQNMVAMLVCVRRGGKVLKKQTKGSEHDTDEHEEQYGVPLQMEKMETEGLTLLSTVSRKVGALFGMSNFEFEKDREDRARDLYQTYVSDYHSKLRFDDVDSEPTGLFVEHEAIDSSVPTRAEIKLRSKQAVETYLRLE